MIFQRETKEFLPIVTTRDGAPATTGVKYAITPIGERPTTWVDPVVLEDQPGIMIEGLTPGTYSVWVQVTTTAETPVIKATTLEVV